MSTPIIALVPNQPYPYEPLPPGTETNWSFTPALQHRQLILDIYGSGQGVRILAGQNPPAFQAALGDLVLTNLFEESATCLILIDTARFLQADGTILIEADGDISVRCFGIP